MTNFAHSGFVLAILLSATVHAQTELPTIVVGAPAPNVSQIEPSRAATVVTAEEIERKGPATVADILRDVPGIEVVQQGGVGQTSSVFIRGARSEDTLVLIDGMEANDVMSPASGYDFSSLPAGQISRIEVFRGPQSVRFGSGALGGVINIVTKEGQAGHHASYAIDQGSYQTNHSSIAGFGRSDAFSYFAGLERLSSQGFSAASRAAGNTERDAAEMLSASTKLAWRLGRASKIEATLRYIDANTDLDRHGGLNGDDPNNKSQSQQLLSGLSIRTRFWDRLKSKLGFFYSESNRKTANHPDAADTTDSSDHFLSESKKLETENELPIADHHTLRFAVQWRSESGGSDSMFNGSPSASLRHEQSSLGESLTYLFDNDVWFSDVGLRTDQSSHAGQITSSRASFGRKIKDRTKLSLTYGTGFKLPSLYQLYSVYGDRNLHQESSQTYDFTVEQDFGHKLTGSVSYYVSQFKDLIDYNMTTNRYFNVARAHSYGFESQAALGLPLGLSLEANYTYAESKDESTNMALLRRPRHAAGFLGKWTWRKLDSFVRYRYKGSRPDVDPTSFARITDAAYDVVDWGGSWRFSDYLKLQGRVENLLDRKYEEVAGYGTPELSFYLGVSGEI